MEYQIEKQWYVVSTYNGHENKVKDNLEKRIETQGLTDYIFRVIVAEHEVPVMRDGQPTGKTKMKNIYPGYIFVEMIMTDEAWYIVRNTPGVTGFVGSSGGHAKIGDTVRILAGSFEGIEGEIESIDSSIGEVTISTILFGRPTPITVKFSEIEKL